MGGPHPSQHFVIEAPLLGEKGWPEAGVVDPFPN